LVSTLIRVLIALELYSAGTLYAESPTVDSVEFFERKVRPLLIAKCQTCHGAERQKGGLRLDSRESLLKGGESGPVVVVGEPNKSELIRAINYEADGFQMPPTGKLDPMSVAVLTEWVRLGIPWSKTDSRVNAGKAGESFDLAERAKHWSFQPLHRDAPPKVSHASWCRNVIDDFVAARLEQAQLEPAPPAERRTLLRRITYDLTGLPPTIPEIRDFLSDESPMAYERVVERLLASPHYGVRWGRHWLDLVRYAESYGHEFDYDIPWAWPYRDYVVRAVNDDVPYNDFVIEHIAGDLLGSPRSRLGSGANESIIGTAFWWFGQAKHSPVDLRAEECETIDNQIDVFAKTFLGLSVSCARCHDHKFDPIRTDDYYALAGFLQSSHQQIAFLDESFPIERFDRWRLSVRDKFVDLSAALANVGSVGWLVGAPNRADAASEVLLSPWRVLGSLSASQQFAWRRRAVVAEFKKASNEARHAPSTTIVFEDFAEPNFAGWRVTGAAFGTGPSRAGDFVVGTDPRRPIEQFASADTAHSGLISPKLRGAIRSKTFTIEKPFIHYRASRHGTITSSDSHRPFKSGQLNLIIDGFQIIRAPLYGEFSLAVPQNTPLAWYTQDVSKFVGSRAYIEIVDEDDGWIVVDSIVFSSEPRPPRPAPNQLIGKLLEDESIDTPAKLADGYARIFKEAIRLWSSGRLAKDPFARDRVAILNLMRHFSLPAGNCRSVEKLAALLAEWRRRESGLEVQARTVALVDGSAENEHVLIRGNPSKPGPEVPRRFLEVFGSQPISTAEAGSGRFQLSQGLTGPAKPLLARVFVNRLWHHHFGRGIVASPDDFGKMGQPPTHPALLDDLAQELINSGWSTKHVQRLIVLSSTYRMSSRHPDELANRVDPANRLLHRMPVQRLEGEAIRDSLLSLAGRLDERLEGPSVPVHLSRFMDGRGRPTVSGPIDGAGRRSIYLAVRRNFATPLFVAFDYPSPSTTAGRRGTSNVPAQALALLNDSLVAQQAEAWSKRVRSLRNRVSMSRENTADRHDERSMIAELYESAFARLPTVDEMAAAQRFLNEQMRDSAPGRVTEAWSDLCHVLVNVKEFTYVY